MYSLDTYSYVPRYHAYQLSDNFKGRFNIVYSNPIKLHRGVNNKLQFRIFNQDQKPVNITSEEITFRLFNVDNHTIYLEKTITNYLPLNGLATISISESEIDDIITQRCNYSLTKRTIDGDEYPLFVDQNSGAKGQVEILHSIKPAFEASTPIGIPSIATQTIDINPTNIFYSSSYSTDDHPAITLQSTYSAYSGIVYIQGSSNNIDWYNIVDFQEFLFTGSRMHFTEGFHPYLRYKFERTAGTVTALYAR